MSEDKRNIGPPDRDRISPGEDLGPDYWTPEPGVSRDALREAVEAAGPVAEAVRNHLAQNA